MGSSASGVSSGLALVVLMSACAREPAKQLARGVPLSPSISCGDAACSSYSVRPFVRTHSRYGIGCLGNVPPGETPNPRPPPESYRAADIGKPGFPTLTADEAALVTRVRRHVRSSALRIAWVDGGQPPGGKEFIIFNAVEGPCNAAAGGDAVLNGACNEFYEPGENPYFTMAAPGCMQPIRRPWMRGVASH